MNNTQNNFLSALNESSTFSEVILFIITGLLVVLGVLVLLSVLTSIMGQYFISLDRKKANVGADQQNKTMVTANNS